MEFTHLIYSVEGRVATITLNRPEKRNAFNATLIAELTQAFTLAEKSGDVRIITLNANGNVFSAGADLEYLQELSKYDFESNLKDSQSLMRLFLQMYKLKKPIIGQIQGPALAGGCGLATVCDIVIASRKASFGYPEVRIGFVAAIVMIFLIRRIGEGRARELLLTGKTISADEAGRFGLINEVVDPEQLQNRVREICEDISLNTSGSSIAITKDTLSNLNGLDIANALDFSARINAATRMTDDCKRGIKAFLEKQDFRW
jgi:methylglutaconyl-CoA hydratase